MDPLSKLYGALAGIAFLVLVFFAGYGWRWHGEGERDAKRVAQEQQLAAEDHRLRSRAADFAEGKTVAKQRVTQQNFRAINTEIKETVTREIYLHDCIDDDGVRLWNDASEGRQHRRVQPPHVDAAGAGVAPAPGR